MEGVKPEGPALPYSPRRRHRNWYSPVEDPFSISKRSHAPRSVAAESPGFHDR